MGNYKKHMAAKTTKEEFIRRAKLAHGDKYDYSKVDYKGTKVPVEIICPEHGSFWQKPEKHTAGQNCPKCSGRFMDKNYFIERAREIHGNKYNYNKVDYKRSDVKVKIICPKHGEFSQTPRAHLNGEGCPKCYLESKPYTTEEYVNKAIERHGTFYDYSLVNYQGKQHKIKIICPVHGEFIQRPMNHLQGAGCPVCGKLSSMQLQSERKRKPLDEFIKDANTVHNNKYDYSKVEYINMGTPICIICPEHGKFWQRPADHLNGNGCSACSESLLERTVRQSLKNNNIDFEEQKTFDWLKDKRNLFLDFFIPTKNVAIECQGRQHFEPIDFFGGRKAFNQLVKRDNIKNNKCKEHQIEIIYFANDEDYINNYRYPVITSIENLLASLETNWTKQQPPNP